MLKTCFVIMPIGDPNLDKDKYDLFTEIYEDIIIPSVKKTNLDLECIRVDKIRKTGNIIQDIVHYLINSELVIADLTNKNPNVFYELGVRHTFGKQTILISQKMDDVPFDLRPYRTLIYGKNHGMTPRTIKEFKSDLEETIKNVFNNVENLNNPIYDFVEPSRRNALLSLGEKIHGEKINRSEYSLKNVEEEIFQLQQGQKKLSIEVKTLNKERRKLLEKIETINISRASTRKMKELAKIETKEDVSGWWKGVTGRMEIKQINNKISGNYDWQIFMAGHINGIIEGRVIKFDWDWIGSSEKGNGFFLIDDESCSLKGSWFFDHEEVDIEEAIQGKHDKLLHPWSFKRIPSDDKSDNLKN